MSINVSLYYDSPENNRMPPRVLESFKVTWPCDRPELEPL